MTTAFEGISTAVHKSRTVGAHKILIEDSHGCEAELHLNSVEDCCRLADAAIEALYHMEREA